MSLSPHSAHSLCLLCLVSAAFGIQACFSQPRDAQESSGRSLSESRTVEKASPKPEVQNASGYFVQGKAANKEQYDAARLLDEGLLLLRSNADEQAAEKFKQSVAIFDYPEAHHSLGLAYAKLGKFAEAASELKRATELNPTFSDSWFLLAGLYQSSGKLEEAIHTYNEFLRRFPDNPNVGKVNAALGVLNARFGQSEMAVAELARAVELNPSSSSSWMNLAGAYQAKGDMDSAIRTYGEFLTRFPDDPACAKVCNLRESLLKEKSRSDERKNGEQLLHDKGTSESGNPLGVPGIDASTQRKDDYLGIMLPLKRWPRSRLPITVFIADGSGITGYRASFRTILKRSFEDWGKAAEGSVSFAFVDRPEEARLKCGWTDHPEKLNGTESGSARLLEDQSYIAEAEISFLTLPVLGKAPLSDNFFRMVALHEIGHALGLAGHSDNPEDIMFYSTSLRDCWRELSGRDARTIRALYRADI